MNPEISKLLNDIFKSICVIEGHLGNISTVTAYSNDIKTIDAVERRLAIIGEALWKADRTDASLIVSDKKKIISLRHILVHDYDLIEDAAIWMICKKNMPILKKEVETILNSK